MTVEEAIKILEINSICSPKATEFKNAVEIAKNAMEKQIPKKSIIKYHKEDLTPVKYGRLIELHCPNCGRFIVATYETDAERGGGIHTDLRGCSTCLQAIDFTGYYHIDKLDEEIELE